MPGSGEDLEAPIFVESWGRHYNTVRPDQSLGYKPPAPEVFIPAMGVRPAPQPRPAAATALAPQPIVLSLIHRRVLQKLIILLFLREIQNNGFVSGNHSTLGVSGVALNLHRPVNSPHRYGTLDDLGKGAPMDNSLRS